MYDRTVGIGAEARGKLRRYKAGLTRQCAALDAVLDGEALQRPADAFTRKSALIGRQRAFVRFRRILPSTGLHFEGVRYSGPDPLAAWVYFRPRESIGTMIGNPDPSLGQPCIGAEFLLLGAIPQPNMRMATGLWSIEVPDHALGRLLERAPKIDPEQVLLGAHRAVLRARFDDLEQAIKRTTRKSFLLHAGPGAFIGQIRGVREEKPNGDVLMHIYARLITWLADEQIYEQQIPVATDAPPGEGIGDAELLPCPLREIRLIGDSIELHTWTPGLPGREMTRIAA